MKNKLKQIIDFKEGQKIKGFFLCIEKHLRFTKKNDKYIDITLRMLQDISLQRYGTIQSLLNPLLMQEMQLLYLVM